jgi:hypothetical protein
MCAALPKNRSPTTPLYFGRARDGAADVPTTDADRVELVAGKGVVGDRFSAAPSRARPK